MNLCHEQRDKASFVAGHQQAHLAPNLLLLEAPMTIAAYDILTGLPAFRRTSRAHPRTGLLTHIGRTIALWRARRRDRRGFAVLNDRDLQDLRISRWELERELSKPFWRD